jgi:hypothetical protein
MSEQLTIHNRMVTLLQRDFPGSQTKGFRRAIQKLQWDWENWDDPDPGESKPTWDDFMDYGEAWKGGDYSRFMVYRRRMYVCCLH